MAYEPRRTLLIGLCALAVVFAAALFPAAGVGEHPRDAVGAGGPGETVPEDTPTPEPLSTPTPDTETGEATDETPTSTPTATPVPESPSSNDGGTLPELSLSALLAAAARAVAGLFVAGLVLLVGLLVRGAQPGTPRIELPFDVTIELPFTIPEWFPTFSTRISRLTMGFVVSVSASVTQLLDATAGAARAVAGGLGIALGEGIRGSLKLLGALPAALASGLAALATLPAAVASLPGTLTHLGGTLRPTADRPDADAREVAPDPRTGAGDGEDEGPTTVEEAWLAMTELLPVPRRASTTPGEFARAAVERGVPAAPVRRLTRAFEDVVYGGKPVEDRADRARAALERLRSHLGGET